MKVYKNIFNNIISSANLFLSWDKFKSDKQKRRDVQKFEWHLEENIFQLHRDLKYHKYKHGGYASFYVRDPKQRHIHKADVRDRVLHHAVFNVINSIFEPTFISDSLSCRIDKGTHKGIDILEEIVFSFKSGVPLGNLTSQLFANVYLNKLDQFIKHELKVKHYIRYTDDFVIVSEDKLYLKNLIEPIRSFLSDELALELHPKKVSIRKFHQGIDFLGYVVLPHYRLLRTKTKNRIIRKLKKRIKEYKMDAISKQMLEQALQSYLGVLSHANAYKLEQELKNQFWFWLKE